MTDHLSSLSTLVFAAAALALLIAPGSCAERPLPAVRPDHPRLLVTAEDLPRLRAQTQAYPEEWKRIQDAALWAAEDPGYGAGRGLRTASLAYLITGEEKYLKNVVAMAENVARNHKMDTYATPEALFGMALAYDWCYHGLTDVQRSEMARAMLRMAEHCDKKIWRHSDFNNHFLLEKVWPFTYTALALCEADPEPTPSEAKMPEDCGCGGTGLDLTAEERGAVTDYLRRADQFIHEQMVPAANYMAGTTGGQFEGYGYDSWGYARPLAYILEGWRTGTGEDLFPQCTAARNFATWFIYGRRPDGKMEHFDDADVRLDWGEEDNYVYLFARHYQDGHAQWMGDQMARRYNQGLWPILLWRDPGLAPQPPADLPIARRFDPLGWVLMRSSWKDDATFASFQCGPFLTGHQHLDNNAFTIQKRNLLAVDPGINAYGENIQDGYRQNYYSRTIAHNTVSVYDPKETFPSGSWSSGPPGAANDGGQVRMTGAERVQEVAPGDKWHIGQLTAYAHGDLYTYAVGDATKSYNPAKVKRFVRHFLYLPPDLFVILDEVESTDPTLKKTWLLHTVNEPKIDGNTTTVTNGGDVLTVRTVWPAAKLTTVGGPGKECWVDGKNWPSREKKEWPPEAGAWRLEVSPTKPAAKDVFITVLQADGSEIAKPNAVSLSPEKSGMAVHIHAQGREYRASFSTAKPECHLRINEGDRPLLDEDLR